MPIYTNSKEEEIDTSTMAQSHIERALAKAQREGNENNVKVLEEELIIRESNQE